MKSLSRYQIQNMGIALSKFEGAFKTAGADPALIDGITSAKGKFEAAAFAIGKARSSLVSTGLGTILVAIVNHAPTASPVVTELLGKLEEYYHQVQAARAA